MAPTLGELGDGDLLQLTRDGDERAYGALWQRHVGAAQALARSYRVDAEDVVAEAFAAVLRAIRNGKGPTENFRAYLFSSVRNHAIKRSNEQRKLSPLNDEQDAASLRLPGVPHPQITDDGFMRTVFESLPERWQQVLWYTEIEGFTNTETARALGIAPNAVAALAVRARRGLRKSWIGGYRTKAPADPACTRTLDHVESRILGIEPVDYDIAHVQDCAFCSSLLAEQTSVKSLLVVGLLPGLFGVDVSRRYLQEVRDGRTSLDAAFVGARFAVPASVPIPGGLLPGLAVAAAIALAGGIAVSLFGIDPESAEVAAPSSAVPADAVGSVKTSPSASPRPTQAPGTTATPAPTPTSAAPAAPVPPAQAQSAPAFAAAGGDERHFPTVSVHQPSGQPVTIEYRPADGSDPAWTVLDSVVAPSPTVMALDLPSGEWEVRARTEDATSAATTVFLWAPPYVRAIQQGADWLIMITGLPDSTADLEAGATTTRVLLDNAGEYSTVLSTYEVRSRYADTDGVGPWSDYPIPEI
jgi:RNA polymerase sigma factor (sigma-70 family)